MHPLQGSVCFGALAKHRPLLIIGTSTGEGDPAHMPVGPLRDGASAFVCTVFYPRVGKIGITLRDPVYAGGAYFLMSGIFAHKDAPFKQFDLRRLLFEQMCPCGFAIAAEFIIAGRMHIARAGGVRM